MLEDRTREHSYSQFTRLVHFGNEFAVAELYRGKLLPEAPLMAFDGSIHTPLCAALPFTQADYFELVDETGRVIREDKRGFISGSVPPILSRFGIAPDHWIKQVKRFRTRYGIAAGAVEKLRQYAEYFSKDYEPRRWCRGITASKSVYV